jgi:hypothetical protein
MQDQDPDPPKMGDEVSRLSKVPPALSHGAFSTMTVLPGEDPNEFIKLYKAIAAEYLPDGPVETHAVKTITECQWRASHLTIFQRAKWARAKYGPIPADDKAPTTEPAKTKYNHLMDQAASHKERGNVVRDALDTVNVKVIDVVKNVARDIERNLNIARPVAIDLLDVPVIEVLAKDEKENLTNLARTAKMDLKKVLEVANDDYLLAFLGDAVTMEHLEKELALLERLEARHSRAMKTLMQSKAMKEILGTDPKSRATRTRLDMTKKTES